MIKNVMSLMLVVLCSFTTIAQVSIGKTYFESSAVHELEDSQIEKLKATTTHFYIDETLGVSVDQFNDILKDVWTITPFDIQTKPLNFEEILDTEIIKPANHSYAVFNNYKMTKTNSKAVWSFHVFDFFMVENHKKKKNGKIKWDKERFALIYFTLDIDGRQDVVANKSTIEGSLMNYNLGYLKNYLEFLNDTLLINREFDIEDDFVDKKKLSVLKDEILYFSDKLIYKYNAFTIKEKNPVSVEELFKNYDYNYEVINDDELNERILSQEAETFYYLTYSQINGLKVITITNSKSSEIIFMEVKRLSYNLKPKDLKQLSNSIEKSK